MGFTAAATDWCSCLRPSTPRRQRAGRACVDRPGPPPSRPAAPRHGGDIHLVGAAVDVHCGGDDSTGRGTLPGEPPEDRARSVKAAATPTCALLADAPGLPERPPPALAPPGAPGPKPRETPGSVARHARCGAAARGTLRPPSATNRWTFGPRRDREAASRRSPSLEVSHVEPAGTTMPGGSRADCVSSRSRVVARFVQVLRGVGHDREFSAVRLSMMQHTSLLT